ncbi:MAG: exodeoxyribonuclease VII large subunit, partial [Planctomycetota bacterium]
MARRNTFFDINRARGGRKRPEVQGHGPSDEGQQEPVAPQAMSVSLLVARIQGALSDAFPRTVTVVGEVSNCKLHRSGHMYCRLKDSNSAIDAMMWRSNVRRLKFRPSDGMEVVVEARVGIYDIQGRLQIYIEQMSPKGQGALELAFRQLKEKLQAEGLFNPDRKQPIPRLPRAVGVITSASGAAIRDIRRTILRRSPGVQIYLLPATVQGDSAGEEIARKIRRLDKAADRLAIDTLIVGRGGGSLEDLWCFNEECVARAIAACRTPVISGVGHEVDVTISDLVADARAATPTAAAEMAVPVAAEVLTYVDGLQGRLHRAVQEDLAAARGQLEACLRSVVFRDPTARIRSADQRLDEMDHRLRGGIRHRLAEGRRRLEPLANRLAALHPARLADNARARLDRLTSRLAWVLGGRSKRCGDRLAALETRLHTANPRHRVRLASQQLKALQRQLESMSHRNVL